MLEQRLEQDIKAALLAGESFKVTTLRGLKAVILSAKVAAGSRGTDKPDYEVITLFAKEAKKRQESADLYKQGGNQDMADKELAEKSLIEEYLPAQLDEAAIATIVDEVVTGQGATGMAAVGQVIGAVKTKTGASADGAVIARLVKERLSQ